MLTNDIVSFEQLGLNVKKVVSLGVIVEKSCRVLLNTKMDQSKMKESSGHK